MQTAQINKTVNEAVDAYDRYEEYVSSNFCKLSYRIDRERDFHISSKLHWLDGFMVGRFTTAGGRGELIRTRSGIREDARGRFAVYIPLQGELELLQFSRADRCSPGSMAMLSMEDPFIHRKLGNNDTIYFFMPQEFVDQRLICSENFCAQAQSVDGGLRRLVRDSIVSLQHGAASMTDMEFHASTRVLGELVLLAFNSSADLMADEPSVRISNLAKAKRVIRSRLCEPELTIRDVARQCGISIGYLHEIFRADGNTISEYIRILRLQKSRHMLETAGGGDTVTDICFKCGFSNASQFSTAFRRAFSVSPRDVLRNTRYRGA